ncbi:MAG: class I SAM-dependent methyltransferase [Bacteroidota bacterium]
MANTRAQIQEEKQAVKDFWNDASCGEILYLKGETEIDSYNNQLKIRYELEPFIIPFAEFTKQRGKKMLEIGVGLGADHQMFAMNGANLHGIDLTERAIERTRTRLELLGLKSQLQVGDAENLPFKDEEFDFVYSWGVIHHSPNTPRAVEEIHRVLRKNGQARVMIYHTYSMIGYMLWVRYALMKLRPFTSLATLYSKYLESPGTKAYTVKEAAKMFHMFQDVKIDTVLTHGDLLTSQAGQRHQGPLLDLARKLVPRGLVRRLLPKHGLFMLIRLVK